MKMIRGKVHYDWPGCFHDFEFFVDEDTSDDEIADMAWEEAKELALERIGVMWEEAPPEEE